MTNTNATKMCWPQGQGQTLRPGAVGETYLFVSRQQKLFRYAGTL